MACKCHAVTKKIPAAFVWALLLSATGLFFVYPCRYLMFEYSIAIPIIQGVVTFFVIANLSLATFVNPGIIPRAFPDEARGSERTPLYKDVDIKSVKVRLKWCVTCQFYRPPRCTHCGICDSCIETFDHHCPWVNNCIGRRNYRFFFMFLLWLSIHMISIFFLCLLYMKHHYRQMYELPSLITIIIAAIIIILIIPIFGLTIYHVVLICRGRTTNEQVTGKFHDISNPYSKGCCKNILYILCSSPYPSFESAKTSKAVLRHLEEENSRKNSIHQQQSSSTENRSQLISFHLPLNNSTQGDSAVPSQSHSQDCEPSPPPYPSRRENLYLSLNQSIYKKQTFPYQYGKSSRALTPPVSVQSGIRFDHSRRSLPPQNRLHSTSQHSTSAHSLPSSTFTLQNESTKKAYSSNIDPSYKSPYHAAEASALFNLSTPFLTSTDIHRFSARTGQKTNVNSISVGITEMSSFTNADFRNSTRNTLDMSDTCCLGNQTIDKLQEIANKSAISGHLSETCVQDTFNKQCTNFHSSHRTTHDSSQISGVNSVSPINVIGNPCVDCQRSNGSPRSSQASMEQIIPSDFPRIPGRRPLSFVKAMEMSDALESPTTESHISHISQNQCNHNTVNAQSNSSQVVVNSDGREVSYEICV